MSPLRACYCECVEKLILESITSFSSLKRTTTTTTTTTKTLFQHVSRMFIVTKVSVVVIVVLSGLYSATVKNV